MNKSQFRYLLEHMYQHVTLSNNRALEILNLINNTAGEKEELIQNIYFSENSPLKVLDYKFKLGGEKDYTGELINISMKYDKFMNELNSDVRTLIKNHSLAVKLFSVILSLPSPYSQILYFKYFKRISSDDIIQVMHISKTTYYRLIEKAVDLAMDKYKEVIPS